MIALVHLFVVKPSRNAAATRCQTIFLLLYSHFLVYLTGAASALIACAYNAARLYTEQVMATHNDARDSMKGVDTLITRISKFTEVSNPGESGEVRRVQFI